MQLGIAVLFPIWSFPMRRHSLVHVLGEIATEKQEHDRILDAMQIRPEYGQQRQQPPIPIRLHTYTFVVAASLSSTYPQVRPGTRLRVGLLAAASVSA